MVTTPTDAGMNRWTDDEAKSLRDQQRQAKLFRLVAINAYVAYHNTLVGSPAPRIEEQFQRTKNPQPGDVVLETSTVYKWAHFADDTPLGQYPGLGVLLRTTMEPCLDEEGKEYAKEKVWYIQPLDGTVPEYRWTDADFIRVMSRLE